MRRAAFIIIAAGVLGGFLVGRSQNNAGRAMPPLQAGSSTNPCDTTYDVASLTNDLVAYWKLDEVSGSRADSWTNAQTLTDNATVTSNPGVITNAGQFTSANSEFLSRADNAILSYSGSFSICAWAYADTTNAQMNVVTKGAGAGAREWIVQWDPTVNKYRFAVYAGGTTVTILEAGPIGNALTNWNFVACTFNSTNQAFTISVNNSTNNVGLTPGNPIDTVSPFQIGAFNSATFYNGRIDEVSFFKRVLTTNEIAALYKCGLARTCCDPGFSP